MKKVSLGIRLIWPAYFVFLAVLLCWTAPACSAYPHPTPGKRVYDFAALLSPEQETQLEQLAAGIAEATTAELDIVTVSSLHGDSIEEYANDLFNEWAIGRADTNNGVLFLIAPNERRVRIEVGYGLEALLTDGLCGNIIANNIILAFKAGRFDEGVISGAERIAGILRQNPEQAQGVKYSAPAVMVRNIFSLFMKKGPATAVILTISCIAFGIFFYGAYTFSMNRERYSLLLFVIFSVTALLIITWAVFFAWANPDIFLFAALGVIPAVVIYKNIVLYRRLHSRKCPKCRDKLRLLNELEENDFLDDGEKAEKKFDSVDYDVWLCGTCGYHLKRKGEVASQYEQCPKCGYRTVYVTFIRQETKVHMKCGYDACQHEYSKTIPKIHRSASSGYSGGGYSGGSSSGSSGGSSGGGGASGGW